MEINVTTRAEWPILRWIILDTRCCTGQEIRQFGVNWANWLAEGKGVNDLSTIGVYTGISEREETDPESNEWDE